MAEVVQESKSNPAQPVLFINRHHSSGRVWRSSADERSKISQHARVIGKWQNDVNSERQARLKSATTSRIAKEGFRRKTEPCRSHKPGKRRDVPDTTGPKGSPPNRSISRQQDQYVRKGGWGHRTRPRNPTSASPNKMKATGRHTVVARTVQSPVSVLGQAFDPFAATPVEIRGLVLRTLRFALDKCSEIAPIAPTTTRQSPSPIYTDMTWALTLREHFRNALTNKVRFAGSLAVHSMRISSYEGALSRDDAVRHRDLSISILRRALQEDATPTAHYFNAIWSLYEAGLFSRNQQNTLMHFRAAKAIFQRLDVQDLPFEVAETFFRGAFVEIGIDFWAVEPAMLPLWTPTAEEVDSLCGDRELVDLAQANVDVLAIDGTSPYDDHLFDQSGLRELVRQVLLQEELRHMAPDWLVSEYTVRYSHLDACAVRRMLLRQALLGLKLDDIRAHVVRLVLHLMVCRMDEWTWMQPLLGRLATRIRNEAEGIPQRMWDGPERVLAWIWAVAGGEGGLGKDQGLLENSGRLLMDSSM